MEGANTRNGGRRRLVLGFDAGCMTCSESARKVEERVGDRLEVRSLHEPQVEHWRNQALGVDAPWVPTLIEIDGPVVRTWTGTRMGVYVSPTGRGGRRQYLAGTFTRFSPPARPCSASSRRFMDSTATSSSARRGSVVVRYL